MKAIALLAVAIALLLAASVGPAVAVKDTTSANYWLPLCRDSVNRTAKTGTAIEQTTCGEMVDGLGAFSCTPPYVTGIQAVRVVIAYIEAHRARRYESFKLLVLEALNAAWPCSAQNQGRLGNQGLTGYEALPGQ